MEQPVKLSFGTKVLQWLVKFAGYIVILTGTVFGSIIGLQHSGIIKELLKKMFDIDVPNSLKGLDNVTVVMVGGILGCLVAAVIILAVYLIYSRIVAAKKKKA